MDSKTAETLRGVLAQYDGAPAAGGAAWGKPKAEAAGVEVVGVNVPIRVGTPDGGTIRLYLTLPASVASSEDSLIGALAALAAKGVPLDIYQPRESRGWGGRGNNGNGNGNGWGGRGRRW